MLSGHIYSDFFVNCPAAFEDLVLQSKSFRASISWELGSSLQNWEVTQMWRKKKKEDQPTRIYAYCICDWFDSGNSVLGTDFSDFYRCVIHKSLVWCFHPNLQALAKQL